MKLLVAFSSLLSFLAAVPHVSAVPVSSLALPYAGVKVLRVPTGPSAQALAELQALVHRLDLSSWTAQPRVSSHVDLEVPAAKYDEFIAAANTIISNSGARTKDFAASIEVMHEDLGASIAAETVGMNSPVIDPKVGLVTDAWFDSYHTIADHNQWLNDLVSTYPSNSRIVTSGTSVQNRTITGVHIYGSGGPGTKPAVIWHGTVHAREWITTMTTEYLAYQLLLNYANSTEVKGYVDKYDFYIFPIVNPDGFAYTQTSTRLWRKNRQAPPSGSTCYGRDINRNWPYAWGQSGGASTAPCDETYKGLAASDAPETTGLAAFINARKNSAAGAKMFIDWHSYSQLFMTPYGYSCTAVAPDATELNSLAAGFATALRAVNGIRYTTGPICTTIYQASGSSVDYVYATSGVKYTFTAELRDTGANGFVLPASQIRPNGAEVWAGVKYLLTNMV